MWVYNAAYLYLIPAVLYHCYVYNRKSSFAVVWGMKFLDRMDSAVQHCRDENRKEVALMPRTPTKEEADEYEQLEELANALWAVQHFTECKSALRRKIIKVMKEFD